MQWLDVEDRLEPPENPIVVDGWKLLEAAGTALVIVRPVDALAESFTRWQGQTLDRIGVRCAVPSAHATLKAFGSTGSPLTDEDERRIVEVVEAWASSCGGLELREAGLEVFREEGIPVVRLEAPSLLEAISNLRSASADAGLPVELATASRSTDGSRTSRSGTRSTTRRLAGTSSKRGCAAPGLSTRRPASHCTLRS